MEDRLKDLKREIGYQPIQNNKKDIEKGEINQNKPNDLIIPDFIQYINIVQDGLKQVQNNNQEIISLKDQHSTATLAEREKQISTDLNKYLNDNDIILNRIKSILEKMKADVDKEEKENPDEPETRIKSTQYDSLLVKFKRVLLEYQELQVQFKNAVKTKVKRQVRAIDDKLSPEELEVISEDPEAASKLIQERIIGKGHIRLVNAVADIQDKQRDIARLEQSVAMIIKMLQDLALLVHAQGEQIDNIEVTLNKAKNYLEKGVKKLKEAKENHISAKKKMCIALICLLVIGIIFLILGTSKVF